MHRPTSDHWAALKRLLRYLSGTLDHGFTIYRDSHPILHAFSDADWAGDKDDYMSTMGHIVFFLDALLLLGVPRSKSLLLDRLPKPSTGLLLLPRPN